MQHQIKMQKTETMDETFERFIISKKVIGVTDKTIKTYREQYAGFQKYAGQYCSEVAGFTEEMLAAATQKMRAAGLSNRSIKSYTGILCTFFRWCRENEIMSIAVKSHKAEETIKTTYTDNELIQLLKKPNMKKCDFSEYLNWVIINFLMNCGCRAATIRNIKTQDLDCENNVVYFRHTKNKKVQIIPLCTSMKYILLEYLKIRGGEQTDYLFPNDRGGQMTENTLASAIRRYNLKRGVSNGSIHSFRHTFARKYLLDCGGNAFTLQKLLGHSTLDMTKHYCAIFNVDIVKNFDEHSPLNQMNKQSKQLTMR